MYTWAHGKGLSVFCERTRTGVFLAKRYSVFNVLADVARAFPLRDAEADRGVNDDVAGGRIKSRY